MSESVRRHYELYPYPQFPLLASVRRGDTYALNLEALWSRFNGELPPPDLRRILIAGCGSFAPYPFALANPQLPVTALDLSRRSLDRARLHCLLHGLTRVSFVAGDLTDPRVAGGPFGFIDAYGVLHHLDDPSVGLKALAARLGRGGVIRIMLYSRFARREEEAIRFALRLLGVREPRKVLDMVRRSRPGSRLRRFFEESDEVGYRSGLADALLHPCVHTYRIDQLLELVEGCGLTPLLFAHPSALTDVRDEVARIREMESRGSSPGNFVLYLGSGPPNLPPPSTSLFRINPCLAKDISRPRLGRLALAGRLGHRLEPLDSTALRFLRRFASPVPASQLTPAELEQALRYAGDLVLLRYRG
ncbi:SAM-dependent methyltransferase [Geomonas sp. Red276]